MQRVDTESFVRPGFAPSSLAQKFTGGDDVEYFADPPKTRWGAICHKRNFFAVWKADAITTGEIDKSYPALRPI